MAIITEHDCTWVCDRISNNDMTLEEAMHNYNAALVNDPTESNHAAHIRDAIRDNFDDSDI